MGVFLWILLIGLIAGVLARLIMPGPNKPHGFVLTTLLGVAGAFLASLVGEAVGLLPFGRGAGLVGATIGSVAILFVWRLLVTSETIRDHGI